MMFSEDIYVTRTECDRAVSSGSTMASLLYVTSDEGGFWRVTPAQLAALLRDGALLGAPHHPVEYGARRMARRPSRSRLDAYVFNLSRFDRDEYAHAHAEMAAGRLPTGHITHEWWAR